VANLFLFPLAGKRSVALAAPVRFYGGDHDLPDLINIPGLGIRDDPFHTCPAPDALVLWTFDEQLRLSD